MASQASNNSRHRQQDGVAERDIDREKHIPSANPDEKEAASWMKDKS